MSKYNLNGNNVENSLVIDNTNGISINGSSLFNFPNKYKAKIGSSKYSYNSNINYKINDVDQGTLLSPKIKVFDTGGNYTHTLQTNTRKILCICLGGGAGGTGGNGGFGGNENGGGGGGGGGGGLAWVFSTVNGGETIAVKVGNGGDKGTTSGTSGTEPGYPGKDGGNSNCVLGGNTLADGFGGLKGTRSTDINTAGPGGSGGGGSVSSASSVLDSGIINGLAGTNGENDPEQTRPARFGWGGAGGNGGTNYNNANSAVTGASIGELRFNNVVFLDANQTLDPTNSDFTKADFTGTNSLDLTFTGNYQDGESEETPNYGRGGHGGRGESRANNSHTDGRAGKQGFVIIAEYV